MRHRTLLAVSATFSALTVSLVALGGGAQQDREPAPAGGPAQQRPLTRYYWDAESCKSCHDNVDYAKKSQLCKFHEYAKWKADDKHQNAFKVLSEKRAKDMGGLLDVADVSRDNRCVACHGIVIEKGVPGKIDQEKEGVSCVACHGAYQEWIAAHQFPDNPAWRKLKREEKERDFGMVDLWDPAIRSRKCASCHVGDAEEGKYLTHEMYAAGHPPLPSFEAAQFSEQEPRHWQYLFEKPEAIQAFLQFKKQELEKSKLAVVDGVVALRQSIKLLADGAAWAKSSGGIDLTHFDCYACHHDLNVPGWRQSRGYPGSPGRPQPRPWPLALTRLALRYLSRNESELQDKLAGLRAAFEARPFGDPREVADAATPVVTWLDDLARQVGQTICDRQAAEKLLRELCAIALDPSSLDYDSARQVAWAADTIYNELHRDSDHPADKRVHDLLESLRTDLKLDLPAGTKREIVGELDDSLKRVADYDPARFRARMAELKTLIGAETSN